MLRNRRATRSAHRLCNIHSCRSSHRSVLLPKSSNCYILRHNLLGTPSLCTTLSLSLSLITRLSRTQELLTKIRTICVEIRDIKRTSQKQYIKTPFKGQDKDSPQTTDRSYNNPPHKEEEQGGRPDCSHKVSTLPSLSSPPTDSSDTRRRCVGEEDSSPATYPSGLPSPSPLHAKPPDSLSPSGDASKPADEDLKGYTTGLCSAGIQTDTVLEGRIKGHRPSSCKLPPETQVWKD